MVKLDNSFCMEFLDDQIMKKNIQEKDDEFYMDFVTLNVFAILRSSWDQLLLHSTHR